MNYQEKKLQRISEHIQLNCDPNINDYAGINKGHIIVDDKNGEILALAKTNLKYNDLKAAGKVYEMTIDESWETFFRRTEEHKDNCYRDCWNKLVTAANQANHGLLVINISNIKIFEHCWQLKQLAKQELDGFMFDGYVLLVLDGMSWEEVEKYVRKHQQLAEFEAIMQFYRRISFEE